MPVLNSNGSDPSMLTYVNMMTRVICQLQEPRISTHLLIGVIEKVDGSDCIGDVASGRGLSPETVTGNLVGMSWRKERTRGTICLL